MNLEKGKSRIPPSPFVTSGNEKEYITMKKLQKKWSSDTYNTLGQDSNFRPKTFFSDFWAKFKVRIRNLGAKNKII